MTGAAKGMGREICLALAGEGAHLVLAARDVAPLEEVAARDRGPRPARAGGALRRHRRGRGGAAGRADPRGVRRPHRHPDQRGGGDRARRDAGAGDPGRGLRDQVLGINVRGTFLPTKHVLPGMIAQRYGKIVNISGTLGAARLQAPRGLLAVEVGAARVHADRRARGGAPQHQRQRAAPGHRGGRAHGPALPREGEEARLDARAGLRGVRGRDGAPPRDDVRATSPTPCSSSPPTSRRT